MQVGLSMFLRKASAFPQSTRALIERFVPYPAVGEWSHSYHTVGRAVGEWSYSYHTVGTASCM